MKNVNKNNDKLCIKEKINSKFSNECLNNEDIKNMLIETLLNNKNKFTLDNHFDKNNTEIFLSEKEKYLSEINIEDEDIKSGDEMPEKNKSKKEILMPNGVPSKFTFGQC